MLVAGYNLTLMLLPTLTSMYPTNSILKAISCQSITQHYHLLIYMPARIYHSERFDIMFSTNIAVMLHKNRMHNHVAMPL